MKTTLSILSGTFIALVVQAQSLITVSGGDGTPLFVTLNSDLSYTVQAGYTPQYGMGIAVYNAYDPTNAPYTTYCTLLSGFTVTDSRLGTLSQMTDGFNVGIPGLAPSPDNTANLDYGTFYIFPNLNPSPTFQVGDVITIHAGTAVTSGNYDYVAPTITSGSTIALFDAYENLLTTVNSAPEPSTLALVGLSICSLIAFRRKK